MRRRTIDHALIVAKYEEDIRWVQDFSNFNVFIYDKSASALPNIGREAHTYIYHIVNKYHELDDINVFTQGTPFAHVLDKETLQSFRQDHKRFYFMNYIYVSEVDGQPHDKNLPIEKCCDEIGIPRQKFFLFSPGAVFAVTRATIQERPLEFYENILGLFEKVPRLSWVLERLWLYIFNNIPFVGEVNENHPGWHYFVENGIPIKRTFEQQKQWQKCWEELLPLPR